MTEPNQIVRFSGDISALIVPERFDEEVKRGLTEVLVYLAQAIYEAKMPLPIRIVLDLENCLASYQWKAVAESMEKEK